MKTLYRISFDLSELGLGALMDVSFTADSDASESQLETWARNALDVIATNHLANPYNARLDEIVNLGELEPVK